MQRLTMFLSFLAAAFSTVMRTGQIGGAKCFVMIHDMWPTNTVQAPVTFGGAYALRSHSIFRRTGRPWAPVRQLMMSYGTKIMHVSRRTAGPSSTRSLRHRLSVAGAYVAQVFRDDTGSPLLAA